jgi:ribosomal protein L12E/L44/L45/RPP1/RPP2
MTSGQPCALCLISQCAQRKESESESEESEESEEESEESESDGGIGKGVVVPPNRQDVVCF